MAAPPALTIFPSIQQVEKRREELDALIQKTLDVRPARPYARDRYGNGGARRTPSRSRTRTPAQEAQQKSERPSIDQSRPSLEQYDRKFESQATPIELQRSQPTVLQKDAPAASSEQPSINHHEPAYQSLPEFNPAIMKTDPLPPPPPGAPPGLQRSISRSPMKRPPVRTTSLMRTRVSASGITRMSSSFSPDSSAATVQSSIFSIAQSETPVSEPSLYDESARSSPASKVVEEHRIQHTGSLRRNAYATPLRRPSQSSDTATSFAHRPSSSRASTWSAGGQMVAPPRDNNTSMSSHRHQESIPEYTENSHRDTSSASSEYSGSTDSSRKNSVLTNPEEFYMPEKPHRSIFPTYDQSAAPLAHQSYYPSRPAPTPPPLAQAEEPPTADPEPPAPPAPAPSKYANMTPLGDLETLWNMSNGQITAHAPGPYNLKMFRPAPTTRSKRNRIVFGPSEEDVFYSVNHVQPPSGADEDYPHETLIFRHHATATTESSPQSHPQDDLLPISHAQILPPPAPSMSRANKSNLNDLSTQPATHITTITPVLATLHALDHASKTPQAHTLALVDPKAESPAAARMAERAVKAASDRESCTLTWMRTCPRTGKYELHHPSLGVFTVVVEGDVQTAMGGSTRGGTAISILNPFAAVGVQTSEPVGGMSTPLASPSSFMFGLTSPRPAVDEAAVLARLDFSRGLLHLDVPAIQALGNIYLLDVCVSTLLAVCIAESSRPCDPGLIFAAPPTSLTLNKKGSKSNRIFGSSSSKIASEANRSAVSLVMLPKRNKNKRGTLTVIDWTNASAVMGIEHLADSEDLPRITRGILSVLGASFRTALWLLEFGVRISARMVIGLSRLAEKV
jgi:hypothetical protein